MVRFRAPTSPFLKRGPGDKAPPADHIVLEDRKGRRVDFTPDGVFMVTDNEQSKALLFFLEVDRGTESVASATQSRRDIRQKIVNYQTYFRSGGYKRYEETWGCEFNGFRLLFLVNTRVRHAALCRLIREMPPSGFVWLAEQEKMFELGVSGDIWSRGGRIDRPPQSILGTLSFPSPIPINES